jgi:cobalt-zinc-cadmium efflux system outer membrane protein
MGLRDGIALALLLTAFPLPSLACAQTPSAYQPAVTLETVFRTVRSSDPMILAAVSRIKAARGGVISARTWSNPVLTFESQQMDATPGLPPDRESMTTAMVPLEALYQRTPRIRSANAQLRATQADALATRQQAALDAATTFYRLAQAQVNSESTRDLAGWLDTVVTYNQARVKEGVASEADLIRSQLERDRVQNELAIAQSEFSRAQADLIVLLGGHSTLTLPEADVDSLPLILPAQIPAAAPAQVSNASPTISFAGDTSISMTVLRPELIAARARAAAAEAAIGAERAMFLREIGAMVGVKNSAGQRSLIAGFTLPVPLLDRNQGSVAAARAENEAANFEAEAVRRRVVSDSVGARAAERVLTQRAKAISGGGYLRRADEARRISLGAYREGGTSLLQVIDAAREWREARMSYFETMFAQHRAVLQLLVTEGVDILQSWPQLRLEIAR